MIYSPPGGDDSNLWSDDFETVVTNLGEMTIRRTNWGNISYARLTLSFVIKLEEQKLDLFLINVKPISRLKLNIEWRYEFHAINLARNTASSPRA